MSALTRIEADDSYDKNVRNNDKDYTWQREMEHKYNGRPRTPGRVLPEETFTKSSSEIARILKSHSDDFKQAMSKLTSYINRQGRNLTGADRERLYSAKDSLRNAYGNQVESSSETPINTVPLGHNLDDSYLDTGIEDVPEPVPTTEIRDMSGIEAAGRLLASIQNSIMDDSPSSTRISSVEAENWSSEVTKHDDKSAVPEGTFDKSADDIAKTLKNGADSEGQAMKRLTFYENRGGSNVDKGKLDDAKSKLKNMYGKN
jgi:hypothetical protein